MQLFRRTATGVVAAALVLSGMAAIAPPSGATTAAARPLATPQLLDKAVAKGELTRAKADLYLAYALSPDWEKVPAEYNGDGAWDGTLPLLKLRQRVAAMPEGTARTSIEQALKGDATTSGGATTAADTATCSSSTAPLASTLDTTHFHIGYTAVQGGLTVNDYATSLEAVWTAEIDTFGWAAPPVKTSNPPPGNRYHVRIDALGPSLYGFVSSGGTHAGLVGNNPNTTWNDGDAYASCMVLNQNYSGFPSPPQASLDSTTGHEFNHSLQYGYGALSGSNVPDSNVIEGGATWMEDEAMDGANDNYFYLWPNFTQSMGSYTSSPYPYWIVWRALTERFGTTNAGGGEQVMQDVWEETSKGTGNMFTAIQTGLANKGVTLPDAYHDAAIAMKFNRACGGGYSYPHCLEEGPAYVALRGATVVHKTIAAIGGTATNTVADNYALNWVRLPLSGTYSVALQNTSAGGQLRGTVVCDTGSGFNMAALPSVLGAGQSGQVASFNATGCTDVVLVITNQNQTAPNPGSSTARSYTVTTAAVGGQPSISAGDASGSEGNAGSTIVNVPVTLSAPSASTVTVQYATADGTAANPADYVSASGTVTFVPNDTSEVIPVTVNGDVADEVDETFTVNLSSPTNATIGDGQGVVTIVDDDGGPATGFSVSDATLTEGNSGTTNMVFTVTLNPAASGRNGATVSYATANDTAAAPGDLTATSGSLTFTSGQSSKTVSVPIVGDTVDEADETFTLNLSNPINAPIADGQGVGTIVDDDSGPPPPVTISVNDVSVAEGNRGSKTVTFTVTLSSAAAGTVTVQYATTNGTAVAPGDYAAVSGTLTFTAGQVSKTVSVTIVGDAVAEPTETFTLDLSSPSGATIADGQGVCTITNDD